MKTLYRAYRPQNFEEIVNQNHVKITLQHEIEAGRTAHAYLFCGPRGIGKTTIARIFAKAMNCENRKEGEHEPCNTCQVCKDSVEGRNIDLIEIDAASHTGVDNVRENIISVARVAPSRAKYKVFIIDEVHMLSISAFNALLKLLEEPPAHAKFVLCTTEAHKIPDTIISRTERFDLKRIGATDIVKKLQYITSKEGIEVEADILENIARQANGHMRDAESMLGQVVAIGGKKISKKDADLVIPRSDINEVLNLIEFLAKRDAGSSIGLINKMLDEGINLKRFIAETLEILRKIMLAKADHSLADKFGYELGENAELKITELGKEMKIEFVLRAIERIMRLQSEMKGAFIEQLPFELAIAELCMVSGESLNISPKTSPNPIPQSRTRIASSADTVVNDTKSTAESGKGQVADSQNKTTKNDNQKPLDLKSEDVIAKWNEVIAKVKTQNHSLSFILKACEPRNIENDKLVLAFKYKFHRDRICEVSIKNLIEGIIKETHGQAVEIEAIVDESLRVENGNQSQPGQLENSSEQMPVNDPPEQIQDTQTEIKESEVEANEKNSNNDEDMLNSVLKAFGGKVV